MSLISGCPNNGDLKGVLINGVLKGVLNGVLKGSTDKWLTFWDLSATIRTSWKSYIPRATSYKWSTFTRKRAYLRASSAVTPSPPSPLTELSVICNIMGWLVHINAGHPRLTGYWPVLNRDVQVIPCRCLMLRSTVSSSGSDFLTCAVMMESKYLE